MTELSASGATIGVVTSKRHVSATNTLRAAGLDGHLPLLVAMEDTAVHKPNPEPLLLALQRLGVRATDCVYIGDAVVDVQAAKAAGMASIAVTWGAGERAYLLAAGPLAIVDTMEELRAHLLEESPAGLACRNHLHEARPRRGRLSAPTGSIRP